MTAQLKRRLISFGGRSGFLDNLFPFDIGTFGTIFGYWWLNLNKQVPGQTILKPNNTGLKSLKTEAGLAYLRNTKTKSELSIREVLLLTSTPMPEVAHCPGVSKPTSQVQTIEARVKFAKEDLAPKPNLS